MKFSFQMVAFVLIYNRWSKHYNTIAIYIGNLNECYFKRMSTRHRYCILYLKSIFNVQTERCGTRNNARVVEVNAIILIGPSQPPDRECGENYYGLESRVFYGGFSVLL